MLIQAESEHGSFEFVGCHELVLVSSALLLKLARSHELLLYTFRVMKYL